MRLGSKRTTGFTLIELMIVLVVMAILVTLALPAYRGHVIAAKRLNGRAELLAVLSRQEQFYINNKRYAASFDLLGYQSSPFAISGAGDVVDIDSPDRVYLLSISELMPEEAPTAFTLQAIPQLGQSADRQCGILTLTSKGIKSASAGSLKRCW